MTGLDKLSEKIKEYINLAEGIVNEEMDVEERYNALAGLYKHIDDENGGYYDDINNASSKEVVKYLGKHNLDAGKKEQGTGKALYNFVRSAKMKISEATIVSNIGGVDIFELEMDWKPQGTVWPAQAMLYALMKTICWDGEYYWLQVKIRKNKTLPTFWLEDKKMEIKLSKEIQEQATEADKKLKKLVEEIQEKYNNPELSQELKHQFAESEARMKQFAEEMGGQIRDASEEGKRKAQEAFPVRFTGVAPDGRPIMEYSEEIQKIQREQQADVKARSRLRREQEMRLIQEMQEEDRIWQSHPGKKVSRQNLYFSIGRYVDDINYYLGIADNNRSIESDLRVFRGLRNLLSKMMNDNGGYALKDMKIDPLLADIHYPEEEKYGFRELLKYTEEQAEGGFDVWWIKKNASGLTNAEIIFSLISLELGRDVQLRYDRLKDMDDVLTTEDRKPFYEPTNGSMFDNNQDENHHTTRKHTKNGKNKELTDEEEATVDHIMMDSEKAKRLFKALKDKDVQWLVGPLKENEFVNCLTLPPSGEKIKLHQLCQIRYIARHFIFPPEPGKTIRRFKPEEWDLIRQIFEAEYGNMSRVDEANKDPQNHETVDQIMGI